MPYRYVETLYEPDLPGLANFLIRSKRANGCIFVKKNCRLWGFRASDPSHPPYTAKWGRRAGAGAPCKPPYLPTRMANGDPMPTAALNRLMLITTASAALSACSPATLLNVLAPSSTYDLATGLPYGHSTRQALDVYIPTTRTPRSEPMPVVVFFYGGS